MRKSLLILSTIAFIGFTPLTESGFGDLSINGSATASTGSQFGNFVTCKTTVNIMGFSSPPNTFKVGFYLSTDTTITITDKLIGTYTVIPAMGMTSATCTLNNKDLTTLSVANGTYYIGTIVDVDNTVAENGMTPEIDNNSWAYRNGSVMKTITYPALDAGLNGRIMQERIIEKRDQDGALILTSKSGDKLLVELRDLQGKLLLTNSGEVVTIPAQADGVYVITIKENGLQYSGKRSW
jgi:hypothetical protein